MFEFVRAIHDALHIESTWAFVLVVALVGGTIFGGVALIVDRGYKNALKERPEVSITRLEARSPSERPGEDNWAVTLWVNTSRPLHKSMLYVRSVLYAEQHTFVAREVPSDLEVARYRIGDQASEPSENTKEERYSLFVSPPHDGMHLRLLTKRRAEAALKEMRDNLPQGSYRFQLEVVAANLEEPYRACVSIEWHGDMNTIGMGTKPGECPEGVRPSR